MHQARFPRQEHQGCLAHHRGRVLYGRQRAPGRWWWICPRACRRADHTYHPFEELELRATSRQSGNPRQIERAIEAIEKSRLRCTRRRRCAMVRRGARVARTNERIWHSGHRDADGTCMVPASDSLRLGMLGMHGSYGTNTAVCNTDCLIAVGARFDDRVTGKISEFAPKAETIIHIDIDPSSISKNVKVDIPIVGDINSVLTDMLTADQRPREYRQAPRRVDEMASADPPVAEGEAALREQSSRRERLSARRYRRDAQHHQGRLHNRH